MNARGVVLLCLAVGLSAGSISAAVLKIRNQYGGTDYDTGTAVALDGKGGLYLGGYTASTDLFMTNTVGPLLQGSNGGQHDAFVCKFTNGSTIVWTTYLGLSADQTLEAMTVDPAGNVYATGYNNQNGSNDFYVLKLTAIGGLAWSKTFGGSDLDLTRDIALDAQSNVWVVGWTDSTNFPMVGALDTNNAGGRDGFFMKLGATGQILRSSYLPGNAYAQEANALAIDANTNLFICGVSSNDAWLLSVTNGGAQVGFNLTFGGTGADSANDVARDAAGDLWVGGDTYSSNFPVLSGIQMTYGLDGDGFLARFSSAGTMEMATYFGLSNQQTVASLAVDGSTNVYVTGTTVREAFPMQQIFVALLTNQGTRIRYSVTFGSSQPDSVYDLVTDGQSNAYLAVMEGEAGNFPNGDTGTWFPNLGFGDASLCVVSPARPSLGWGSSGTIESTFVGIYSAFVTNSELHGLDYGFTYETTGGTALAGVDYGTVTGSVQDSSYFFSINIPITDDNIYEGDEAFTLRAFALRNCDFPVSNAVQTITDDDPPPAITLADTSLTEPDAGATNFVTFAGQLDRPSAFTTSFSWASSNGTALTGSDYAAGAGTINVSALQTNFSITRGVYGDARDEFDEVFYLNLSNAVNATFADAGALCTILDNDPPPGLIVSDESLLEGDTGSVTAVAGFALSTASGKTITFNWQTSNGTAAAGSDYTAASGTVTFTAGVVSQSVTRPVLGDLVVEPNETFTFRLSAWTNVTVTDSVATVTIVNDDITNEMLSVAMSGGATVTVSALAFSGKVYRLERSTNLFNPVWQGVATNTAAGTNVVLSDVSGTALTQRFYRIQLQP